jgi:RNA polymerase sigma-32 factor
MSAHDASFDGLDTNDDHDISAPAFYLEDQGNGPEQEIESRQDDALAAEGLKLALNSLDQRSKEIISKRWLSPKKQTLQELAAQYGVSAERIRQLEQNAMKKLRSSISENAS